MPALIGGFGKKNNIQMQKYTTLDSKIEESKLRLNLGAYGLI